MLIAKHSEWKDLPKAASGSIAIQTFSTWYLCPSDTFYDVLLSSNILYLLILLEGKWILQKIQREQCAEVIYVLQSNIKINFCYTENIYELFCLSMT